jgi:hypothetical protein
MLIRLIVSLVKLVDLGALASWLCEKPDSLIIVHIVLRLTLLLVFWPALDFPGECTTYGGVKSPAASEHQW